MLPKFILLVIVAQIVDRFINRRYLNLGPILLSDFRPGLGFLAIIYVHDFMKIWILLLLWQRL